MIEGGDRSWRFADSEGDVQTLFIAAIILSITSSIAACLVQTNNHVG